MHAQWEHMHAPYKAGLSSCVIIWVMQMPWLYIIIIIVINDI